MKRNKIIKGLVLFLFIFSFLNTVSASSNLIIQSSNEKNISVVSLSNYTVITAINNNQSANIPYDNYVIKISTTSTKFTLPTMISNAELINNNAIFIFFLVLIFSLIMVGWKGIQYV